MGIIFARGRQVLRIFLPLLFLLLSLAIINSWPGENEPAEAIEAITAVSPTTNARPLSSTAVPSTNTPNPAPTPTASPFPTATIPPDANIRLLGPPNEAMVPSNASLLIYWQWPTSLTDDQFFQVVLFDTEGSKVVGQVLEPNFGSQYSLQAAAGDLLENDLAVQWQVQLLASTGDVLRSSEVRNLRFIEP